MPITISLKGTPSCYKAEPSSEDAQAEHPDIAQVLSSACCLGFCTVSSRGLGPSGARYCDLPERTVTQAFTQWLTESALFL
jgi:hypothetical protein